MLTVAGEQVYGAGEGGEVAFVGEQLLGFGDGEPLHLGHTAVALAEDAADRGHQVEVDHLVVALHRLLDAGVASEGLAFAVLLLDREEDGVGVIHRPQAGDDGYINAGLLLDDALGGLLAALALLDRAFRQAPVVGLVGAHPDQQRLVAKLVDPHDQPARGSLLDDNAHAFPPGVISDELH
jgi:hypothetical protein